MSRMMAIGRQLVAVAMVVVLLIVGAIGYRSYVREAQEFFPDRRPGVAAIGSGGIVGLEAVEFRDSAGLALRGWYAPSTNRAGVVLLHGAGGDRTSQLPEARQLASHGFGVLLFDWPGHGESDGEIHWSEAEGRALVAATDFLAGRPDLDARRLGALGFSMGGAVLARVAPTEERLQAVVLVGTPSDQARQIELENRQWGPLSQIPARWAVQRGGVPVFENQPRDRVPAIAPRPVLIVNGTQDYTVPPQLAYDLFTAAREPKQLLMVEGAGHGALEQAPNSPYLDSVTRFFESALLESSFGIVPTGTKIDG
jgi:pimeloyl-ACP methyl ester carboxylesterase